MHEKNVELCIGINNNGSKGKRCVRAQQQMAHQVSTASKRET